VCERHVGSLYELLQRDDVNADTRVPFPLTPHRLLELALDMARGVAHLHTHSILHRDISARNFLVSECGRVLVSDFGLSRHVDAHEDSYYRALEQTTLPYRWFALFSRCMYSCEVGGGGSLVCLLHGCCKPRSMCTHFMCPRDV
jgi:serine/threonine protein kinase